MKAVRYPLVAAVAVIAGSALVACDPLPSVHFTVTVTAGADADPGDGVCEVTVGSGDCSLRAAVDEANALGVVSAPGGVDIDVPSGSHQASALVVTTTIRIKGTIPVPTFYPPSPTRPPVAEVVGTVHVVAGASASFDQVYIPSGFPSEDPAVVVDGTLLLRSSRVNSYGPGLAVASSGRAVIDDSLVSGFLGTRLVDNAGVVVLDHVSLQSNGMASVVHTADGGQTHIRASALYRTGGGLSPGGPSTACTGVQPISLGYNRAFGATCTFASVGDLADVNIRESHPWLAATSPGIDAIPVGTAGCGAPGDTDGYGAARPADGNGDGVLGCDIGSGERPAA
jgi:hypothetical protein